ncbi:MAG: dihydrodipicolinate synthase family protein [Verrucomicrobiota bacterium]
MSHTASAASAVPAKAPPVAGLVAAVFTPFDETGEVEVGKIPPIVDFLSRQQVTGIYICGSTGEAPSLTVEERMLVAEAYVSAAKGKLSTMVQIGHTCLKDCRELGAHAASIGADAISSVAPYYFKPPDVETLVSFLSESAASAPGLPFYYYHIPALSGVAVDPVALLEQGRESLATLRGIKFTDEDLSVFNACQVAGGGVYDVLFGRDEMFLAGLAAGARGAVGSTFNIAPGLYRRISTAYEGGDLETARDWQQVAVAMIRGLLVNGGEAAIKYAMRRHGIDCGPRRLPAQQLNAGERAGVDRVLKGLGFEEWARV